MGSAHGEQDASENTWFGYRRVAADEKPDLVRDLFGRVAHRYDLMNDLMSGGVHRLWKREMVDWLDPRPGLALLDAAGGTGDIARRVFERIGGDGRILICDASPAMVETGRDRFWNDGHLGAVKWMVGDAEALPLRSRSMDAYTIAFGIRNVARIDRALAEARRVLRPGGRFLCLEFAPHPPPGLDRLYDIYSFGVIPSLGAMLTGQRDAYAYLVESIRTFPPPERFATMLSQAGFGGVRVRRLSAGIAALHSGWRI